MSHPDDHEAFRELLALRLYDELDADETRRLDQHLQGCADCRAFADELPGGLGSLATPVREDLPADWRLEMEARMIPSPWSRKRWFVGAASFAAGIAMAVGLWVALDLVATPDRSNRAVPLGLVEMPAFSADAPPPPALHRSARSMMAVVLGR